MIARVYAYQLASWLLPHRTTRTSSSSPNCAMSSSWLMSADSLRKVRQGARVAEAEYCRRFEFDLIRRRSTRGGSALRGTVGGLIRPASARSSRATGSGSASERSRPVFSADPMWMPPSIHCSRATSNSDWCPPPSAVCGRRLNAGEFVPGYPGLLPLQGYEAVEEICLLIVSIVSGRA